MIALYKMLDLKSQPLLRWPSTLNITAMLIGCSLLYASLVPWLKDPLSGVYSAWQLPLYSGWPHQVAFLNYGLLCLFCALYAFIHAFTRWQPYRKLTYFVYGRGIMRSIFMIPVGLFLFQYLFSDLSMLTILAKHERQLLLIQMYFGYKGDNQLIMLNPLTLNISTLWTKLQLLLNCISYGPILLCVFTWLLPTSCHLAKSLAYPATSSSKRRLVLVWGFFLLIILFGRIPLGMVCEYAVKEELTVGNYNLALLFLNSARFFNPELEQAAYYHIEQGQAQYFLSPAQLTTDSRIYLAATYRAQGDYLDSYQQLLAAWHSHPSVSWIVDEMDRTLERLIEVRRPLRGSITSRIGADDSVLPWLHVLLKVDPSNVYGLYVLGRVHYDLHNYPMCITSLSALLQLDPKDTIRSSLYTYMALSETGLGNTIAARLLLFQAISLDPGYHNNTAREELSGLH